MVKILVFSHISEYVGGAEKSIVDVLDSWSDNHDVEIEFIVKKPLGTFRKVLEDRGWKYHELEYSFWSESTPPDTNEKIFKSSLKNARAVLGVEKIIKKSKPDIVITNSVVCPWAALAAYYQGVPHVWFVREYGDLDHGRVYEMGRKKTLEDVNSLSDIVVANSLTLQKHLAKYIDKEKLTTLYTPFNINKLQKQAKETVKSPFKSDDSLKLVITGSLTPSKGQSEAVEAVGKLNAENHNIEICLVGGNGPKNYKKRIKKLVKKYDIADKVHLIGHQPNPLAYINLADVGIMASRMEAFGRVTFEYMALGKPVVGTDSGATPEMIQDSKNGYLYKPGDIDDLTSKLRNYTDDRSLIPKQGKVSQQKARKMLESEYNSEEIFKHMQKLLNKRTLNKGQPINFSHRWLEYLHIADEYIEETGKTSVKKLARQRLRARAGSGYHLMRRTAKKVVRR